MPRAFKRKPEQRRKLSIDRAFELALAPFRRRKQEQAQALALFTKFSPPEALEHLGVVLFNTNEFMFVEVISLWISTRLAAASFIATLLASEYGSAGITGVDLLGAARLEENPLAPKTPHHPAKAKSCIFLHHVGRG